MTCCPHASVSLLAIIRATESELPPGANGTTSRTGFVGYSAASAVAQAVSRASAAVIRRLSMRKPPDQRLHRVELFQRSDELDHFPAARLAELARGQAMEFLRGERPR